MSDLRGLSRVLGLSEVTFIAVGFMIGGGVFVFSGIVVDIAGAALPLAYGLAMLPVFVSMLPLAMLASAIPTTGGSYRYPSRMVSPGLAFVGIWVYGLASFFGQIPLYSLGCARYLHTMIPWLPEIPTALSIVTIFFLVNLAGVKLAAQLQAVFVVILISALLFYAYHGISELEPARFSNIFEMGPSGLLLGTALLSFTYFGANGVIELGGEIVNPGKVIPRSFLIAFPIVALVYIGVAVATVGVLPMTELLGADEPLVEVARLTCGPGGLLFFVAGGAVLALTTTLNALFIVGTKSLLAIVADGLLPKGLGKIHARFSSPHLLLLLIWILSVAGILSGLSLETLASYSALGGLIIFLPIQIAAIRLPRLYPDQYDGASFKLRGPLLWLCPIVGIVMVLFFALVILVDLASFAKVGWFLLFIVSGVAYYVVRRGQLAARGVDLNSLMGSDDWFNSDD